MIVFSLLVIFAVGVFCYRSQQWALERKKMINVVRCLRHLEKEGGFNAGVCAIVTRKFSVRLGQIVPFRSYPNFSGKVDYPIKHPDDIDPKVAFDTHLRWEGGYGKERKRFCRWCADYLCKKWRIKDGDY